MRLVILCKGKKRPTGYRTPGGYVKTAEGWKKLSTGRKKIKVEAVENWKERVASEELPAHIKAIRIPPAWINVHYSEDPNADLLVTGKDAKGRTQYVYSERFRKAGTVEKFARINALNKSYKDIKAENRTNLAAGVEEALLLFLVMETGVRPGSKVDTKAVKKAYGATTLEGRHVIQKNGGVLLKFTGKKGVERSILIESKQLARLLLQRKKRAGDNGSLFSVDAARLSNYTQSLSSGKGFKTKDLRTRLATAMAVTAVKQVTKPANKTAYKKAVREVAKTVAAKLGNTPIVALQSYINPVVFAKWKVAVAI